MSAETEGEVPAGAPAPAPAAEPLPGTRDARSGAWLDDIRRSEFVDLVSAPAPIPWWRGRTVQERAVLAALRLAQISQFGKLRR